MEGRNPQLCVCVCVFISICIGKFWGYFCHFSAIFLPIRPEAIFRPFLPDFGPKAPRQSVAGQRDLKALQIPPLCRNRAIFAIAVANFHWQAGHRSMLVLLPVVGDPVGQKRQIDVAGQKLPRDNFCLSTCLAITLTAGLILKEDKKPSLVGERQFGRHFRRQFGRG